MRIFINLRNLLSHLLLSRSKNQGVTLSSRALGGYFTVRKLLLCTVHFRTILNIVAVTYNMYLCTGGAKSKILHYESGTWRPLNCPGFSLPQGTILIGEIVEEICLQEKLPTFVKYFHLFDAVFLSGLYIGSVPLINRFV